MSQTTIDKLLGARFEVEQPAKGYRIAVDTLLLASAVPVRSTQTVLELGCGVGGAMLALAVRVSDIRVVGVEILHEIADICCSNIERNGFSDCLSVIQGDISDLPDELKGAFDHVAMNPPFHEGHKHVASEHHSKKVAHMENADADISVWIKQAALSLNDGGVLTMIHRSDRQDEILRHAQGLFAEIHIKPIISKTGHEAKRVIVRAMKRATGYCVINHPPFLLYGEGGRYSEKAEGILRNAQEMVFA